MCIYVIGTGEYKYSLNGVTYILKGMNVRCYYQKLLISIPFRNVNAYRVKLQSLNNVQKINIQLLIRRLNSTLYLYSYRLVLQKFKSKGPLAPEC
jgi:hypothetical protein